MLLPMNNKIMFKAIMAASVFLLLSLLFVSCATAPLVNTELPTNAEIIKPMPTSPPENEMEKLIKANLEILAEKDPNELLLDEEFANKNLFDEIVALGEEALPFLELITDRSYTGIDGFNDPNGDIIPRLWAVHAIYAIKPETYDLTFLSPDGKFTAKVIVDSFSSFFNHGRSFNDVQIIDNFTNEITCTTEMQYAFSLGGLFYPDVNWSPDSRFAVINCTGRRSGSVIAIDTQSKSYFCLPGMEEAISFVSAEKDIEICISVARSWFDFESWETEKIVKISYNVGQTVDDQNFYGWYIYDLIERKIVQMEYSFKN